MNRTHWRTAIRRGTHNRMTYFADFARRAGCDEAEAWIVARRAEYLFGVEGVHMDKARLMVECKMAKRRAA
jgi:hypothetical protein